ncbi:MAG: DUF4199 domain-containing protein [Saprospiraceae bacterium]|nr:DUF4199 domain-containing protein [Saprospiraceae bacterium]
MNNFSQTIRIGILWGIGSMLFSLIQYLITGSLETGVLLGILIFLLGIGIMYYIGIKRREMNGNYIAWKEAMTHMWVGAMINVFITTIYIFIFYNFIDPDLKNKITEAQIQMIENFRGSMGDQAANQQIEKLENTDPFSVSNTLIILGGGILLQFVISCVVALVVKKDDPNTSNSFQSLKDNF